ncbi:hypothetical protein [Escherichia coli]|uniref:hypothetical protein n=1 Tax=Escherichia coli TaxID=562 RepID=UPI0012FE09C3|nr:hypothetical protein [Escherichia coli]ELO3113186.1 hypothetical protein [Escherichia coli]MVV97462.1 hypothetical protein [Escherichia coli]MWP11810.1 hypothetical protein [Escherichia coli]
MGNKTVMYCGVSYTVPAEFGTLSRDELEYAITLMKRGEFGTLREACAWVAGEVDA